MNFLGGKSLPNAGATWRGFFYVAGGLAMGGVGVIGSWAGRQDAVLHGGREARRYMARERHFDLCLI